jgi:hypothetical protein
MYHNFINTCVCVWVLVVVVGGGGGPTKRFSNVRNIVFPICQTKSNWRNKFAGKADFDALQQGRHRRGQRRGSHRQHFTSGEARQ